MTNHKIRLMALICGMALTLGACGIKPDELAPPSGGKDDFPHTYPDISTDPAPLVR